MKLLVVGATGLTGRQIVEQALAQGHTVTALVRDPARASFAPPITRAVGDVLDAASLTKAVVGQEAVLCSLDRRYPGFRRGYRGPLPLLALFAAPGMGPTLSTRLGRVLPARTGVVRPGSIGGDAVPPPDVAATERRLAATLQDIREARAEMLPRVTDGGYVGQMSEQAEHFADRKSHEASIMPFISIPVFEGGRNAANVALARARRDEAAADYREVVLTAFREADTALDDPRQRQIQAGRRRISRR